jgi:hypothetical protein
MLIKYFLFIIIIKKSLQNQSISSFLNDHKYDNLIQFKSNSTTCAMFSKTCKIEVILNKNLNLNSLQINPYKTKFYKFSKLQLCENGIKKKVNDCHVRFHDAIDHEIELNIAYIFIDAIIVGKTQIFLNYNFSNDNTHDSNNNNMIINGNFVTSEEDNYETANESSIVLTTSYYLKHDIIISSPQRLLDKIHMIYVIIFQTIVSVFMGLLLDVQAIIKIIKMPVPVLVGFVSQYLFMPLVRAFLYFP